MNDISNSPLIGNKRVSTVPLKDLSPIHNKELLISEMKVINKSSSKRRLNCLTPSPQSTDLNFDFKNPTKSIVSDFARKCEEFGIDFSPKSPYLSVTDSPLISTKIKDKYRSPHYKLGRSPSTPIIHSKLANQDNSTNKISPFEDQCAKIGLNFQESLSKMEKENKSPDKKSTIQNNNDLKKKKDNKNNTKRKSILKEENK